MTFHERAGNAAWHWLESCAAEALRASAAVPWPVLSKPEHRANIEKARPLW